MIAFTSLLFFLSASLQADPFGLQLPDGDHLDLKIDPTNKSKITLNIDGKVIVIPLVKPPPTLEEQYSLPKDLIDSASTGHSAENGASKEKPLSSLFSSREFHSREKPISFNGDNFQNKVYDFSRELFETLGANDKDQNIANVYSEAKYQEESVRDFFKKQRELWEKDPEAGTVFREMKIKVLEELFQDLFHQVRGQLSEQKPDFDHLKKYIKSINDYNSTLLAKDDGRLI